LVKLINRTGIERRSGSDRRKSRELRLEYTCFLERRNGMKERRMGEEPREGYVHLNHWQTVYLGMEFEETPAA